MTATVGKRKTKQVAITLSLLAFGFMSAVLLVVFFTEEPSGVTDFVLPILSPFMLAALV